MNWLLVVIVLGAPVKTDLVYRSLQDCLAAELQMRGEWVEAYNAAVRAKSTPEGLAFLKKQISSGTCIPADR